MNFEPATQLKVLMVIDSLGRGGAENLLVHLAPALKSAGVDLEVAALTDPMYVGDDLTRAGVVVHGLAGAGFRRIDQILPRLAALVRRVQPDVIHAHLFFSGTYTALLPSPWFSGPRILTLHGFDDSDAQPPGVLKALRAIIHRGLLPRRMRLVAVSRALARDWERVMGVGRIEVIYNAVPTSRMTEYGRHRAEVRARHGLPQAGPVIVCVGRAVELKGHFELIDAAVRLRAEAPDATVAIIGDGPLEAEYRRRIAERSLEDTVRLVPGMPQPELLDLVASCDVFTMPSHSEGMSVATLEGMALGLPAVVSDIESMREIVEPGVSGLLVPPRSPEALARALLELIERPDEARRLGTSARLQVLSRFDTHVVARQWVELYERSAERRRPLLETEPRATLAADRGPVRSRMGTRAR